MSDRECFPCWSVPWWACIRAVEIASAVRSEAPSEDEPVTTGGSVVPVLGGVGIAGEDVLGVVDAGCAVCPELCGGALGRAACPDGAVEASGPMVFAGCSGEGLNLVHLLRFELVFGV